MVAGAAGKYGYECGLKRVRGVKQASICGVEGGSVNAQKGRRGRGRRRGWWKGQNWRYIPL